MSEPIDYEALADEVDVFAENAERESQSTSSFGMVNLATSEANRYRRWSAVLRQAAQDVHFWKSMYEAAMEGKRVLSSTPDSSTTGRESETIDNAARIEEETDE